MIFEQIRFLSIYIYVAALMDSDSLFGRLAGDAVHWRRYMLVLNKYFDQLKTIFRNPRRYPREAVIIISAVVLAFLILFLLVITILSIKKQYGIYKASRSVRKRLTREELTRRLVITGSITAVLVSAIVIGTSRPELCVKCHEVEKSQAEWQKSTHKDVGCLGCHYESGVFGYVIGTIGGADNALVHLLDGEQMSRAVVSNDSCLQCHQDVFNRTVVTENEIKVRHKDLVTGGMSCVNCHPSVAHQVTSIKTFAMNRCVTCHNSKTASSKCKTCHQQDIAYKASRTLDDWPKVKGIGIKCVGCHQQATTDSCVKCHGLTLPHSAEFKQKHAMQAEQSKGALCFKCHWNNKMSAKRMCGCHSQQGEIHGAPEEWYYKHQTVAKTNGAGCNCHGLSFCQRCHDDAEKVYPMGFAGGAGANQMHGGWNTGM